MTIADLPFEQVFALFVGAIVLAPIFLLIIVNWIRELTGRKPLL